KGKTLGIVGESGCGKSVTSLSIMRLIPSPPGKIVSGEIWYQGKDLTKLSLADMRAIRGNEISMIFQEPMTSLNPVFTIGNQLREAIALHQDLSRGEVANKAVEMLKLVGIPSPEKRIDDYPHQLSGGMRQRVMIAMALSCNPNVLIADEPTTALDVTIQAQILDLLRDLQARTGLGLILITHDLGVVAEMAHDVLVMYAGRVVEEGKVEDLFRSPRHPYTKGLLGSIPRFEDSAPGQAGGEKRKRLEAIPGIVPNLLHLPKGCRFQDRCAYVIEDCKPVEPTLRQVPGSAGGDHPHCIRCIRDIDRLDGKPASGGAR
ncbi:MAG: ABC transporter ATP-binding protein, partial [Bacteriovoracia bacterium]